MNIKDIRKKLKMKQREFAKLIGCTEATVSRWENNKFMPSLKLFEKIIKEVKKRKIRIKI